MAILRPFMRNGLPGPAFGSRASTDRLRPALALQWLRRCAAFAVYLTLFLWLIDVVQVLRRSHESAPATSVFVQGLLAALFRGFALTLPPALLVGVLSWLTSMRRLDQRLAPWRRRALAYVVDGSSAEQHMKSGALLAFVVLGGGWAFAAVRCCESLIVGMARPQFSAMACTASCAVLLLMAAVMFAPCAQLATLLCEALATVPVIGARCFGRVFHVLAWLSVAVAVVLGAIVYRYRDPLSYLPWPTLLHVLGASVAAVIAMWLVARVPHRTRRWQSARSGLAALLVLGTLAIAALQSPLATRARQLSERDTLTGRMGQVALLWALDRDHDGYLPGFGGGDCAPADRRRNPGATDVPGNGVDEDCDGGDLDAATTALRGKLDYPVPAQVPQRPPIVLITVDAFAARHMHALGYPRTTTPNIDAFAARSVFFRQCYAQGPSTRLSFPSIFTSRWDTQIEQELVGQHPFPISTHERLLAEVLKQAGYDTSAVLSDPYFSPRRWRGITRGFSHIDESAFSAEPKLPHDGARVTEAAIAELKQTRDKPLFLWVHYYDAHSPHQQPPDVPAFGSARQDVYDAELNLVDREVGKLLAAIEEQWSGQALVVLSADHGIAFDEPRHATFNYGYDLYSAVLHVPLIVHGPWFQARNLDGVVSTLDIAPTLANVLRLHGPLPYEGMSLLPELTSGRSQRPPELMHQMFIEERKWKHEEPLERVSLRTGRFDLLQDRKTGAYELYDYRNDYFETHDLALDPLYAAQLAALRRQLTALLYSSQVKPDFQTMKAAQP